MDKIDSLSRRKQGKGAAAPEANRPPLREVPPPPADVVEPPEAAAQTPRSWERFFTKRYGLMIAGPLAVLLVVAVSYLLGGRYVSTDNAYVRSDKVMINTDIGGVIAEIKVHEGDTVAAGQELFRLDDEPYRIALAAAEAKLGVVKNQIANLQATYRQHLGETRQAETNVSFYEREFKRQSDLAGRQAAAEVKVDQARNDLDNARNRLIVSRQEAQAALAELGGDVNQPIEAHARYRQAVAEVEKARRDLRRTIITAPAAGVVTKVDTIQVGTYLPTATGAFSLVVKDSLWIEANPKETDLTYLKPGNAAVVTVDSYPGVKWRGTVESISPATGAEFSLIPAQNASGNWVKVVQRVPVRVRVEMPPEAPPLRAGMSAAVEIDTGRTRGFNVLWQ